MYQDWWNVHKEETSSLYTILPNQMPLNRNQMKLMKQVLCFTENVLKTEPREGPYSFGVFKQKIENSIFKQEKKFNLLANNLKDILVEF